MAKKVPVKKLVWVRDVTMGKFSCEVCNGGQNLSPPWGWDRVQVFRNLSVTTVILVTPVDTSLWKIGDL